MNVEFTAKPIVDVKKNANFPPVLKLGMKDKNGKEYCDGDIVKCLYKIEEYHYQMFGYIRYFGGRFEIVCPFNAQRYLMGLNPSHEVIGHMYNDFSIIDTQATVNFKPEGGIKI